MHVNRRLLYAGIFLVAIGGVLVAADLGDVDKATLTDTARLWPFALVALGVGLVVRRTELSLPAGILAVTLPGLVLGAAIALAPTYAGDCDARREFQDAVRTHLDVHVTVNPIGGCS